MSLASSATKTTHEKQLIRLVRKHKLLRARDLAELGLPTIGLTRLVQAGKLDRVARGLYALPGAAMSEHRSLAEVALRVPKGVVCLLSALQFHEIGTQAPFKVWLAIPNRATAPRIEHPAIRVVRMSDDALTEGPSAQAHRWCRGVHLQPRAIHRGLLQVPQQDRPRCGHRGAA
jgi:predicted transcriptional regulator of viral defense system